MGMPAITVEVALTTDPGATPTWTDLSARFRSFNVNRGRQRELDRFGAGRCRITLANEDRALDPTYAASPYYPNVVPMRRVRIRTTWPLTDINSLDANQSSVETDATGWGSALNATLARTTAQALAGVASLQMTSVAAGGMGAQNNPLTTVPATPGVTYIATGSFRAATAARTVSLILVWLDAALAVISTTSGAGTADTTSGWTSRTVAGAAPATAAYVSVQAAVAATGAGGEVHYIDQMALGVMAMSVTAEIFNGYVDSWDQQYLPPQEAVCVIQTTDAFKVLGNAQLLSSAYATEVDADDPTFWWRLGDPSGSTVAAEAVTGNYPLSKNGSPTFGAAALSPYDVDGAVQFAAATDGLQRISAEGTWPFTTAVTVEFMVRYDSGSITSNPIATFAVLPAPGGTDDGIVIAFNGGTGGLDVQAVNNAGTAFSSTTTGVDLMSVPGVAHHVAVTIAAGASIKIYVDGADRTGATSTFTGSFANTTRKWLAAVGAYNYPPFVGLGGVATVDEMALYASALSAARITAHADVRSSAWAGQTSGTRIGRLLDAMPWPAVDRNVDTGLSTLQAATLGGTVLSALQKVEETEQGALFVSAAGKVRFIARDNLQKAPYSTSQATFGDSGSELEYGDLSYVFDDQLIFNDVQATRDGGVTQIVGDATSQTRYLRRTKVFDGMLYQTDANARDLAGWWISHYKDPLLRATGLKLEPSAGNDATHFPQILTRELLDRVTVRRRPQNLGAAIDQETLIEGITHDVTAMEWRTTWNLSPADTQVYWLAEIVGHGEAGVNTRAAF